jgi:hypothetical protein
VLGRSAQPAARRSAFDPQLYRLRHDCGTTGTGQIPSNIGHQEGKHRADSGAPPGPLWRDDHRISARAPALRRVRVRAVLGRRRAALDLPLSLHTATRRQGRIRGPGDKTLRDASSRATKALYPALSLCDLIFSGVFERHPRLKVAIVEFELAWAPHLLSTMDYTYRKRHGEAIYRFKHGMPLEPRSTLRHMGTGLHAV